MGLFQFVVFGLETGSLIAVSAIGFTLIYGIVNMINFAYGEYITVGTYLSFFLIMRAGLNIWVALLAVTAGTAAIGWLISRAVFTPLHEDGPIPLLLTSIGLGFVLRNGFRLTLGLERRYVELRRAYDLLPVRTFRFDMLGGFFVTTNMLVTIVVALSLFGAVHLLLTRTDLGIAMRATSSNEALAELSGIPAYDIRQYTWVLASALAGVAGVLLFTRTPAAPEAGFAQILLILAAAVLGGAGSPYGAVVGSYVIGLSIALVNGLQIPGLSRIPISMAFLILVVILLVRPSGIAGKEVTV
ncbi:MAG: branched-chain amino acid ABC transporter permease [Haloferacaceae archaeon]